MRSETVTTVVDAPQEAVFDYLSEVENLPSWATEFARELRRDADGYVVVNGLGAFRFEIRADRATGVIDMFAGPDRARMAVFPTRAVALPDGRTAYSFTMFQAPDMPDDLFEAQHASLCREFANIESAFDDRTAGGEPSSPSGGGFEPAVPDRWRIALSRSRSLPMARRIWRAIIGVPTLAKPDGSPRLRIVIRVAPAPASSHV